MENVYSELIFDDEIKQLLRTAKSERKTIKLSDKSGKTQKKFYYGIVNDDGIIGNAWKDAEHNIYSERFIESAIYNQVNNKGGTISISTFESEEGKMENMKKYINCRVYHTGISAAHTIELPGRFVSIVRGDVSSVIDYYTRHGFVKHGTAIGNDGRNYTIYANGPDVSAAGALVIAIPGGGDQ